MYKRQGDFREAFIDWFLDIGVEMNRVDNGDRIGILIRQLLDGAANVLDGLTEVLATVRGDQDQTSITRKDVALLEQCLHRWRSRFFDDHFERVNRRVTRDFDELIRDTLPQQVLAVIFSGCKVQISQNAGNAPIALFGEGLPFIKGAKLSLIHIS